MKCKFFKSKVVLIFYSLSIVSCFQNVVSLPNNIPIVINTWAFVNSSIKAWHVLKGGGSALDAVEQGAMTCEIEQCDGTVGYGGSPDENGETTLDALMMDGKTMNVGAVAALRRVKNAVSVARHVLENSKHSILAGDQATEFAKQMGFEEESLTTAQSKALWMKWRNEDNCQPNFWVDVVPDSQKYCGPYKPKQKKSYHHKTRSFINEHNHDTIGIIAIDDKGNLAAGTSTNGAKFKTPGRVGDSPIPGAGAYADNSVGGAAATGDGDVMLRFLPSFLAVEEMRRGASPREAAKTAVGRITAHYPDFMGAVIALSKDGSYGAACNGISNFPYVVYDKTSLLHKLIKVDCK